MWIPQAIQGSTAAFTADSLWLVTLDKGILLVHDLRSLAENRVADWVLRD